jgi:hypothetical protein
VFKDWKEKQIAKGNEKLQFLFDKFKDCISEDDIKGF